MLLKSKIDLVPAIDTSEKANLPIYIAFSHKQTFGSFSSALENALTRYIKSKIHCFFLPASVRLNCRAYIVQLYTQGVADSGKRIGTVLVTKRSTVKMAQHVSPCGMLVGSRRSGETTTGEGSTGQLPRLGRSLMPSSGG